MTTAPLCVRLSIVSLIIPAVGSSSVRLPSIPVFHLTRRNSSAGGGAVKLLVDILKIESCTTAYGSGSTPSWSRRFIVMKPTGSGILRSSSSKTSVCSLLGTAGTRPSLTAFSHRHFVWSHSSWLPITVKLCSGHVLFQAPLVKSGVLLKNWLIVTDGMISSNMFLNGHSGPLPSSASLASINSTSSGSVM